MKANDPLTIAVAIIIIIGTIYFISTLAPRSQSILPPVQQGEHAPGLQGIQGYINTDENISIEKGKVVLVDFWTYSCINCIRTLPYLTAWDQKYRDDGLLIIGVHSPEFEFEKDYDNVLSAVRKNNIQYPVVLDNNFETWRAYGNRFWPRKYLIDINGNIRYDHIGEGAYEETERVIQELLAERNATIDDSLVSSDISSDVDFTQPKTPELYLGYDFAIPRNQNIGNGGFLPTQSKNYILPDEFKRDTVYLEGTWKSNGDFIELQSETGKVVLKYRAKDVNIVAGGNAELTIRNGDEESFVTVDGNTLYNVVANDGYVEEVLTIEAKGDFELYTFTFG